MRKPGSADTGLASPRLGFGSSPRNCGAANLRFSMVRNGSVVTEGGFSMLRFIASGKRAALAVAAIIALGAGPLAAQQLESVDPDAAYEEPIDGDRAPPADQTAPTQDAVDPGTETHAAAAPGATAATDAAAAATAPATGAGALDPNRATYGEGDLIGAAEGVFG